MGTKIVKVAKITANVVRKAPEKIRDIESTLLTGAKDLYQKIKKDPQEYQATINFIKLLKNAVTITEEAENEAEEAAKAASGAAGGEQAARPRHVWYGDPLLSACDARHSVEV